MNRRSYAFSSELAPDSVASRARRCRRFVVRLLITSDDRGSGEKRTGAEKNGAWVDVGADGVGEEEER